MDDEYWFLVKGPQAGLRNANHDLSGTNLYLPRLTRRVRVSGRARRRETIDVYAFPGYGFLAPPLLRMETRLSERWGVRIERDHHGSPTVIQDHELDDIRDIIASGVYDDMPVTSVDPVYEEVEPGDRVQIELSDGQNVRGYVHEVHTDHCLILPWNSSLRMNVPRKLISKLC